MPTEFKVYIKKDLSEDLESISPDEGFYINNITTDLQPVIAPVARPNPPPPPRHPNRNDYGHYEDFLVEETPAIIDVCELVQCFRRHY